MSDIESLMYSYPAQGEAGFTEILSLREEFWPSIYDIRKAAQQEGAGLSDESISRQAVKVFCARFMLANDRLLLYYSTGSGKTVISAVAAEPLVRHITEELVDSYLEPRRSNIRRVIVIVSSDSNKRDFIDKIVKNSVRPQYQKAVSIGATQSINERLATYSAALAEVYAFFTKTEFLAMVYGTHHAQAKISDVDPEGLSFVNNSIIIIDEIQSFSKEETIKKREDSGEDTFKPTEEEDHRYAQFHHIFHTAKGIKLIGMSATPMKDSPQEIIKVMNIILPLEKQIPFSLDVLSRDKLMPYLQGYVSYFKTRTTRVIERGIMLPIAEGDSEEFAVVFPIAMSSSQETTYKKIITERDAFNRNALRTSNIVYPDGSSDHAGFLRYFLKNERGLDGMEPTEDLKKFLRKSRANRELLSPKFCVIADIARTSKGVIFVYMSNLESGLVDLAAFLDAEGFERYTPRVSPETGEFLGTHITREEPDGTVMRDMLISKKPRYSLIIGETKTVSGRLEGILDLANISNNADGEYLKIILGSAAIREGYDIRNSITIVYGSPGQTETSQIQPLGRIIRPGAHRELLKRYPFLPPIVSSYRLASYIPGSQYEGVDVKTYLESARKDRRIKVVERMLRDGSVDCQMLHSINYEEEDDVVNDSPACLYGPCDYRCYVSPKPSDLLDSSSMNALYRGEKILRLRDEIFKTARISTYIPVSQIEAVVESEEIAQRVIETLNISKEQLQDRYGRQVYLYHDKNGVYFSTSPTLTGLLGDGSGLISPVSMADYEHYVTTLLLTPLDIITGTSLLLPATLEAILTTYPSKAITESLEADKELLQRFSRYLRREVVSKAELLERVRVRGEQRIKGLQGENIYWVDYSGLLFSRGDLRVYEGDEGITESVDKNSSGNPLRFVDRPGETGNQVRGAWNSPETALMGLLRQRWRTYMNQLLEPYGKRYKFFGVIKPSEPNVLRIAKIGSDNAKTLGRALSSWSSDDMREVLSSVQKISVKEADKILSSFKSQKDVNDFLIKEFEKHNMLLRL